MYQKRDSMNLEHALKNKGYQFIRTKGNNGFLGTIITINGGYNLVCIHTDSFYVLDVDFPINKAVLTIIELIQEQYSVKGSKFEDLNPTNSQLKMYNWQLNNSDYFDKVKSMHKTEEGIIVLETEQFIYQIGIRGGLTSKFNK